MARQRPHMRDRRTKLDSDPIGQPVADRSPERARDPDRPEAEIAGGDQHADADERRPGRDQQRDEGERLAEGQEKYDRRCPRLVDAHEFDQLLAVSFEACKHPAGLAGRVWEGQSAFMLPA